MTKEEKAERDRAYYEANKEKIKLRSKEYRRNNKEKRALQDKIYRDNNKEKVASHKKEWALENKEKRKISVKKWALKNKDKVMQIQKRYYENLELKNSDISKRALKAWSFQIKKRDNYTCQMCCSTKKLHAHHILSKSKHPTLALILNNGITLCEACHIEEHALNGDI
jgi:5-methylcytosine-specific restriction endonuclease McrA